MFFPLILCHWSQFWHQKLWRNEIFNFKNSDFCKLLRLPASPILEIQKFHNPYCHTGWTADQCCTELENLSALQSGSAMSYRLSSAPSRKNIGTFFVVQTVRKFTYQSKNVKMCCLHWSVEVLKYAYFFMKFGSGLMQRFRDQSSMDNHNISSVVEFQRWWVLKSNLFGQESIFKKSYE